MQHTPRLAPMLALGFGLVLSAVVLELGCQAYAMALRGQWNVLRTSPEHYYRASDSALLGYELAPSFELESDGRVLRINSHGIRDDSDDLPRRSVRRIAILGDSVVFGIGLSQEDTLGARLQRLLDENGWETRVLSFGVPGYSLEQMEEHLRRKDAIYEADEVVYVLNPNDFTRLGRVTEGASNGLYRMYRRPLLKSPWMIRKAIYRLHKGPSRDARAKVAWYRWLFEQSDGRWRADLAGLAAYTEARGERLTVVLLPAGSAYDGPDRYALADVAGQVSSFLSEIGVAAIDATEALAGDPALFTPTDHLSGPGNQAMAELLASHLGERTIEHLTSAEQRPGPDFRGPFRAERAERVSSRR